MSEHHQHDHEAHAHSVGGNSHAPANFGRAFAIGIVLNGIYILFEVFYGFAANSLALLADGGHNFGDVLGLAAAWAAAILSRRRPDRRYTYGAGGNTIFAALANAVILLIVTGGLAWEAVRRFFETPQPTGLAIMVVAAIGIVISGNSAALFMAGRESNLKIRGVFLHLAGDTLVALGVVVGGAAILATGWAWLDPAISLAIGVVIVIGTWSLLRDSVNLALDAVPAGIDRNAVHRYLAPLPALPPCMTSIFGG